MEIKQKDRIRYLEVEKMEEKYRNYENLQDLAKELDRQKESRYDVVVPSSQLHIATDTDGIFMTVPQPDKEGQIIDYNKHKLTDHAHRQVASKTDIPWRYYEKMRGNERYDLLAENINTWLPSKDSRLVRVLDNEVRALLSDKYRCIDNHDVYFEALSELDKIRTQDSIGLDINKLALTEQHMYIKVTSPDLTGEIFHSDDKIEPVHGGIIVSNSEVGAGTFKVEPFMNVLVCQNGLIREQALKRRHIGKKHDIGYINWSEKTVQLEDEILWSKLRDMIHSTFDQNVFQNWIDEINNVAQIEIPKPTLAVDNIVKHFKMPDNRKEALLNQFVKETPTQWGISMAVTRCAQDESNYESQIEMEKIGAKLLNKRMTPLLTVTE